MSKSITNDLDIAVSLIESASREVADLEDALAQQSKLVEELQTEVLDLREEVRSLSAELQEAQK